MAIDPVEGSEAKIEGRAGGMTLAVLWALLVLGSQLPGD